MPGLQKGRKLLEWPEARKAATCDSTEQGLFTQSMVGTQRRHASLRGWELSGSFCSLQVHVDATVAVEIQQPRKIDAIDRHWVPVIDVKERTETLICFCEKTSIVRIIP